ncbi:phosphoglycerate mutase family protein [Candidatus Woesearchaeota archaeon]|nr:phosphoglycerate mutase family protein [Candidatus Woesearchaeota archaeon]
MLAVLLRHGETVANRNREIDGQRDGTLTERGRTVDARNIGLLLDYFQPAKIDSTDLRRGTDTLDYAQRFAATADHQGYATHGFLREVHYGSLQGCSAEQVVAQCRERGLGEIVRRIRPGIELLPPPLRRQLEEHFGIESLESIQERVQEILAMGTTYARQGMSTWVVNTHGGFISYLLERTQEGTCGSALRSRTEGGHYYQGHDEVSLVNFRADSSVTVVAANANIQTLLRNGRSYG